jgi:hypothetical protein
MQIDLTQIILAVITLIGGIVARYVIPWLKSRVDERKMDTLVNLINVAVYAAEQLYNSDQGQEKKEYVVNLLAEKGYVIDVDNISTELNAMIESTVKELKIEMNK